MWIEIPERISVALETLSLPVRECGLKYPKKVDKGEAYKVTPRAGVWIEISKYTHLPSEPAVTPRAGVWIEMYRSSASVQP